MNALKEKSKDTDSSDSADGQSGAQQDPLMVGNDVNTSDAMEGVSGRVGSYDALPSAGTDVTNRQLESVQKQLHLHSQQLSTCTMLLEEREYAITSLNEMIDSLKKRNTELTLEVDKLKTKVRESDKSIAAGAVMKQEMESLLQHCRKDIVRCKQEKQELEMKLKQMEGDMLSKSNEYNQASGVYERLKELELQCNEKTALITRLRAESSANEKNYALKTTLMVNTDIQLTECKELNSQLKSEVKAVS